MSSKENIYKLKGTKMVPAHRFNLHPARPSLSFKKNKKKIFTVVEHSIVKSLEIKPTSDSKEFFPLVENKSKITANTVFKDRNSENTQLVFPKIEIKPLNDTLFYYEPVFDINGNEKGYYGRVTLQYSIKETLTEPKSNFIKIMLKEAKLNLHIEGEIIQINGVIDENKKSIVFNLKDEAVKIAFFNLTTNFDAKSSIDLFFAFKGFSKSKRNTFIALNQNHNLNALNSIKSKPRFISTPLIHHKNKKVNRISATSIRNIRQQNNIRTKIDTGLVKSTFFLRKNEVINYKLPEEPQNSLYKDINGGINKIPFNLNQDFSQYQQIFIPGIENSFLSIYKSTVQPNTFLLIPKQYHLTKDIDTKQPCITTIFHAFEDGTGLTEDISKISFVFAIGPKLSDFDLAKLKFTLFQNNQIDTTTSNYLKDIHFLYPTDIDSDFEISGNTFIQKADVTVDGKYFLFNISTENINQASLLINSLNNSLTQYANINFKHKEIKDTSTININLQETVGEVLSGELMNTEKKIKLENHALSPCKVNAILSVDDKQNVHSNNLFFTDYPLIKMNEVVEINQSNINPKAVNTTLTQIFIDHENIEDISSEFNQLVSSSTDYNRYITVSISEQDPKISKIYTEIKIDETGSSFKIMKLKHEFRTPILFNFIKKNTQQNNTEIICKTDFFDQNENIVHTKLDTINYVETSKIII